MAKLYVHLLQYIWGPQLVIFEPNGTGLGVSGIVTGVGTAFTRVVRVGIATPTLLTKFFQRTLVSDATYERQIQM